MAASAYYKVSWTLCFAPRRMTRYFRANCADRGFDNVGLIAFNWHWCSRTYDLSITIIVLGQVDPSMAAGSARPLAAGSRAYGSQFAAGGPGAAASALDPRLAMVVSGRPGDAETASATGLELFGFDPMKAADASAAGSKVKETLDTLADSEQAVSHRYSLWFGALTV